MDGSTISEIVPVGNLPDAKVSEASGAPKTHLTAVAAKDAHVSAGAGGEAAPHDLKRRTARGALISTVGQASNFVLRIGSMVVLARLLTPEDFGLVGMVTACTGFLSLFRDCGLSMATVQRASISREQTSMLFWINLTVGTVLAVLCGIAAPFLAVFYHEPRLLWVTVATGLGFVFGGAAAQHRALLQRNMRFMTLTAIDLISLVASIVVGIGMALAGLRYWSLVGMALSGPIIAAFGLWIVGGWVPGPPRRGADVLSMIRYGGTVTINCVIVYVAYNMDKVLLGRYWGAAALGLYGRAYQLINLPTDNLNSTIGLVAFPALARLQNDWPRLKSYFLKGYGLFLSLVMPITTACALFAEDIVRVLLGPKWDAAVPVFRLLAPTILSFALMNPHAWLMLATGKAARSLKIALLIAPTVILGYVAGLSHGSHGVAAGFSISITLLVVPVILWAIRGTPITAMDELKVIMRPLLSVIIGAFVALVAWSFLRTLSYPLLRLIAANIVLFGVYLAVLLFVMGQKEVYIGLLKEIGIWPGSARQAKQEAA
jgi:O-antigen/teichoic acid export membrane protein